MIPAGAGTVSSNILKSGGGRIPHTPAFVTKEAPPYEDDIALLPSHRRTATPLDRLYMLRLGDCVFAVPPELIRVTTESRAHKTFAIRQASPMMTQAGYSEREVRVTLYFTTLEEINGYAVPGPAGATYYMDGLRPLISMIRHSPLLPVRNEYLNLVHDIWAVMVGGLLIQTVEGFPGVLAVELVMRPVNMEAYLMRHGAEYDSMINWPLFRWNYQRAIADGMKASSAYYLPKVEGGYLDDTLKVGIVDVDELGNDPWDYVPYREYPLGSSITVTAMSIQFQNLLAPLQTQLSEDPVYQYMGAMDASVMLQIRCADPTDAAMLVQLHRSVLAQAREHHNRIVTSPVKIDNQLLNAVGITHVMIEAMETTTVPGFPGVTDVMMALTSFNPTQASQERLNSYTPAGQYKNVMDALQTIDPKEISFIEQALLAEMYFQNEQLYPDLDLPTYGQVKEAVKDINAQRASIGLPPIPSLELNDIEWSDASYVDADFWMCYPGLQPGGVFNLDALNVPAEIKDLVNGNQFAGLLRENQRELAGRSHQAFMDVHIAAGVDLKQIPHLTVDQIQDFIRNEIARRGIEYTYSLFTLTREDLEIINKKGTIDLSKYRSSYTTGEAIVLGALEGMKIGTTINDAIIDLIKRGYYEVSLSDEELKALQEAASRGFFHPNYRPLSGDNTLEIARAFHKAQQETGISAAFWVALAGVESNMGECGVKRAGKKTEQWLTYNIYDLKVNMTYNSVPAAITGGAGYIHNEYYNRRIRRSIAELALDYAEGSDAEKRKWVQTMCDLVVRAVGDVSWAMKFSPTERYARASRALQKAGDVLYRDYQSFDILDAANAGHRKPRRIEDDEDLLAACMHNMVRFGHKGRLTRAFPTFLLLFIDEGGMDRYARKVWANFYMYHSVISIDLIRERNNPADALHLTLTNVYGTLNWKNRHTIPVIKSFTGFLERIWDGLFFNWENNQYLLEYRKKLLTHFDLRPGMRVHLRMGYSANPSMLPVVFNGNLTEVEFGDTIEMVAQGDGRELLNLIHDTPPDHKTSVGHTASTALLQVLTADQSDWLGRLITATTGGDIIGEREKVGISRYGLEHFGPMKLELVFTTNNERAKYERYKNIYPADFDSRVDLDKLKGFRKWLENAVRWMDKMQGHLGFNQANDDEKLIWVNVSGKTVWDLMKVLETACPTYIAHYIYHGFDSRVFFGMPLWNVVYGWRLKRARMPSELLGGNNRLDRSMFVELYRPFIQFHHATSLTDIIGNAIRTTNDFPTVVMCRYELGNSAEKTEEQYADFAMRPDMQRVEVVDLGLYQALPGPDLLIDALGITNTRDIAIAAARNHLAKRMGEMYTGEIYLIGDPAINPHDVLHIVDTYWNMAGNVYVNKVIHHLSVDSGFVTVIEPKLIAMTKDSLHSNDKFASILNSFSSDVGYMVRNTMGIAAGLILMGKIKAVAEGGSALLHAFRITGQFASGAVRLAGPAAIRFGNWVIRVAQNLVSLNLSRANIMTTITNIRQYGQIISQSWAVTANWVRAAAADIRAYGFIQGAGRTAQALAAQAGAGATVEVSAASALMGSAAYMGIAAAVMAATSLATYWISGIIDAYTTARQTIIILPLAYRDGFLVAGIEGWRDLIPGYPDPKYVYVRSKEEAAQVLGVGSAASGGGSSQGAKAAPLPNWEIKPPIPLTSPYVKITDRYGYRILNGKPDWHYGIDIAAPSGTLIYPIAAGVVTKIGSDSIYGNYVEITTVLDGGSYGETLTMWHKYAHMRDPAAVKEGQWVKHSTLLGYVGSTGLSTGPHLHLEIKINGQYVDPADYILR